MKKKFDIYKIEFKLKGVGMLKYPICYHYRYWFPELIARISEPRIINLKQKKYGDWK
jgi:hypothetical protein